MRCLTIILLVTATYTIILGLWDHSWQLLLAGVAVAVIWPLICPDAEAVPPTKGKGSF